MNKYIIGLDGGGTKTLAVLYNEAGEALMKTESGFANFSVDEIKTRENIDNVLSFLTKELKKPYQLIIILGISGISKLEKKEEYINELEKKYKAIVDLKTDAHIALYAVDNVDSYPVIMAIGGTGSIILTKNNDEIRRFGGYGHLLGDEGSAYHLAISALKLLIEKVENNTNDEYKEFFYDELKINELTEIVGLVYPKPKAEIALYAKLVTKLAQNNNSFAIDLLKQEGALLANKIINAHKALNIDTKTVISLKGGFLLQAPFVKEKLINVVKKEIKNVVFDEQMNEPVWGAYILGLKRLKE